MESKTKEINVYVAGHKGMVGQATYINLLKKGYNNLITSDIDLRNQVLVQEFFETNKPDIVINGAAKVGGILANDTYPYQFIMDNMMIQNNLIHSALQNDVQKFIFLGSSCIYPKFAEQPIKEEYLLTNSLEPTNEWYAIAKLSGIKACQAIRKQYGRNYISLLPTNLYGIGDNFDLNTSHVLPAMIRKIHEAKVKNQEVTLWGSGTPMREFMYVEDVADAIVFVLENNLKESVYNVGVGKDISIKDLAEIIKSVVGYDGEIFWDKTKPDGTPRKLLDVSKLNKLGWTYQTELIDGITKTYKWFLENE